MPSWKKPLLYFVSLLLVFAAGITIDLACGPEPDPYDYSVTFFHNNLTGGKAYLAFNFTNSQALYDWSEPANEQEVNAGEWAAYIGKNVKPEEVQSVMYKLDHRTDSVLLAGYLNLKTHLPDSLKGNAFLHALKNNREALLYYRFAKIIEPAVSPHDPWSSVIIDTAYLLKNAAYALKEEGSAKNPFIKLRYDFQAQRLFHYAGQDKQAIAVYEKYLKKARPGYYIQGLTRELRAGEEWRAGDAAKAAYLFSKVFANFPERRIQAYQNYVDIKVTEKAVIALTRSNEEKAVIYAMNGFYTPAFSTKYLKKVYSVAPSSPFVEILLTREINKLEAAYVTPRLSDKLPYDNINSDYYGWNDSLKKAKNINGYIHELQNICTQIAGGERNHSAAFELIAKAYLEWMAGDNKAGFLQLAAINDRTLNTKLYDQKQLVKLLLIAQQITKPDSVSTRELVPSLRWLDKKVALELSHKGETIKGKYDFEGDYHIKRFTWSARDFYQKILVPLYLAQHDTAKAALAMLKGMPELTGDTLSCYHENYWDNFTTINFWQYYLHSSNLRQIMAYKHKESSDPYLKLLSSGLKNTSYDCLYNLLGTAYLREHNYKKAVMALSQIKKHSEKGFPLDDYGNNRLKSDPFIAQLKDYPKNYLPSQSSKGYTKLNFARRMYVLQLSAKRNPKKAAQYYFTMAAGLYNTSYYGNAWFMISYVWEGIDMEMMDPKHLYYEGDVTQTIGAEQLFLKARQLSHDPEFKARCTFMAAKCRGNRYKGAADEFEQYKMFQRHNADYSKEIKRNDYFKQLQKNYSTTHFYKTAVDECSYLRDFIAANPHPK